MLARLFAGEARCSRVILAHVGGNVVSHDLSSDVLDKIS